jgi:4-diphosphocytidyl-2-C-methyl-D-erythritol kinase
VLVLPSARRLRTADVYAQADRMGLGRDDAGLEAARAAVDAAIATGDLPELVNELEPAARALEPSIDAALAEARAAGARAVAVCGSGPTVIGLFDTPAAAEAAAARLADRDPPAIAALPVVAGVRHN